MSSHFILYFPYTASFVLGIRKLWSPPQTQPAFGNPVLLTDKLSRLDGQGPRLDVKAERSGRGKTTLAENPEILIIMLLINTCSTFFLVPPRLLFFLFFLLTPQGSQDLRSLTRD